MEFLYDTINFDDKMVCYYDELPLWSSPFGILLLNNIPLKKDSIIVDIGCGTGFPLFELAQRLGESCKVFGIDPWERAIDRANRKKDQYRIKNVELIKGVGENMPFSNEYIDMVISNLGINNFQDPDEVIIECFRVLKSGGKLIFTTNLFGHFDEFYSIFDEVLRDLKLESEIRNLAKHIKKRYSIEDIETLIKRNNFSVKKIIQENYFMRFIDGSSFFNHYFIKLAFLQDWKEIIKEDNWNNVFLNLENRLNNIASKKGEVVFNVPIAYIECEK
ncbi:class I SAM-dependent methyltransferase [Clostridium sp. WILCCON 0269]|uniref:Class I SAM-dependent methyltransferase n=1 Tax=Candidatus Clostridium eludens TaxID=3381663 RepID=A0ABW8SEP7_9CLOT